MVKLQTEWELKPMSEDITFHTVLTKREERNKSGYSLPIECKRFCMILLISYTLRDNRGSVLYLMISGPRTAELLVFLKVLVIRYSH